MSTMELLYNKSQKFTMKIYKTKKCDLILQIHLSFKVALLMDIIQYKIKSYNFENIITITYLCTLFISL